MSFKTFLIIVTGCWLCGVAHAADLTAALKNLAVDDYSERTQARADLREILAKQSRPGSDPQTLAELRAQLNAALQPDGETATLFFVCQMLAMVGDASAVPALADLLDHPSPRIQESARRSFLKKSMRLSFKPQRTRPLRSGSSSFSMALHAMTCWNTTEAFSMSPTPPCARS